MLFSIELFEKEGQSEMLGLAWMHVHAPVARLVVINRTCNGCARINGPLFAMSISQPYSIA
jgi:hypothetical protein